MARRCMISPLVFIGVAGTDSARAEKERSKTRPLKQNQRSNCSEAMAKHNGRVGGVPAISLRPAWTLRRITDNEVGFCAMHCEERRGRADASTRQQRRTHKRHDQPLRGSRQHEAAGASRSCPAASETVVVCGNAQHVITAMPGAHHSDATDTLTRHMQQSIRTYFVAGR